MNPFFSEQLKGLIHVSGQFFGGENSLILMDEAVTSNFMPRVGKSRQQTRNSGGGFPFHKTRHFPASGRKGGQHGLDTFFKGLWVRSKGLLHIYGDSHQGLRLLQAIECGGLFQNTPVSWRQTVA